MATNDGYPSFNIDILVDWLSSTLFSPVFASLLPVAFTSRPSLLVFFACWTYFLSTLLVHLLVTSSYVWRNRLWESDLRGPGTGGGGVLPVVWGLLKGRGSTKGSLDWKDQVVLITGGSGGVGSALIGLLATKNVPVFVLDIVPPQSSSGPNVHFVRCDLTDPIQVSKAADQVREKIKGSQGGPTILINNAGIVNAKLIVDLSPQDVQRTFGANTMSHYFLLREFLPAMIASKTGHVVSIASVLGYVGACQASDYCASKAAVVSLHETLRYELDKKHRCPGIRTTLVCPGFIQTPLFSGMAPQPFPFLIPPLPASLIASHIFASLDAHESTDIYKPWYTGHVWVLKGVTSWMRDAAQWLTAADEALVGMRKEGKQE